MKFSYTKNPESDFFFIKNPNLKKKKKKKKFCRLGGEGMGGVARVSDFFFFFQKNPSLKKKMFSF